MAIKINRQGKEMKVNENSNAFKQLKQAFEGNQSSSIPPQSDLDINNNEKNKGEINMAETETTKRESAVKDNQFKKELPSAPVPVYKNGMPQTPLPPTPPEQAEKQVNEAIEKYNEFVEGYNGFVNGLESSNNLKALITKVLKKEPEENSIWLNGNVRSLISESKKTSNTIEELNNDWANLINKLIEYLPEANIAEYIDKVKEISYAINNGKYKGKDIEDSEKLKLMEKYNKMCGKMLNYTNSVLKRLKRKAEHKGYLKEETAEEKLLKEFVKKYNELLSRGYKIAQTIGDGSAYEIDEEKKLELYEWGAPFFNGYHQLQLDNKGKLPVRWFHALNYLIDNFVPEGEVKETFKNKLSNIGNLNVSGNSVDESKVLKEYYKLSEELFNKIKYELDMLEGTEANGGETNVNEDAEENKGLFSRIKGKASKLVRKGKKVVAHKLDNSEKELDAAQKELKVLDTIKEKDDEKEIERTRFVKQSVMDQPEYETFKVVGQIIATKKDNFGKIFDELKEGPSSVKSLRSKLKVMITDNNISKWKLGGGKESEAELGILYIGIAYLPSGSKGIEAACKGMSVGGIKGSNDETIQKVYDVNYAMKKFCRDGTVGHALVKKVEDKLVALVNKDSIPKIESKFSTLLKLKREAAKLGGKAKETAKKAATKIGKSSVGRAAKSAASSAVDAVKKLPGKFKKSKPEATVENASVGASVPANNVSSEKKPGRAKKAWNTVKSVFSRSKNKTTNNEENE